MAALVVPAYLAGGNPRAQSGYSGTDFFATVLNNIDPSGRPDGWQLLVDNYYAKDGVIGSFSGVGDLAQWTDNVHVFNQELRDPNDVEDEILAVGEGADNDHSGVQQWYRWTINPNDNFAFLNTPHCTPGGVFHGVSGINATLNPCRQGWGRAVHPTPEYFLQLYPNCANVGTTDPCKDAAALKLVQLPRIPLTYEGFTNVHGCQLSGAELICNEQSSAFGIADVQIPSTAAYLSFDFELPTVGVEDYAVVFLDNEPIWTRKGGNGSTSGFVTSGPLPIRGLTGWRKLTVAIYGAGAKDAEIRIRSIEVTTGNILPVANAGGDQVVEATSAAGAPVRLLGVLSDDLDGDALTYQWTGPFGQLSGFDNTVQLLIGVHSITLTVDDGKGGVNSATIFVTVRDTTAPTIGAAPDIAAEATTAAGAVVSYTVPPVTDLVDAGVASCLPASGSTFPIGDTVVTCTATDAAGNVRTATFHVTVTDVTTPGQMFGDGFIRAADVRYQFEFLVRERARTGEWGRFQLRVDGDDDHDKGRRLKGPTHSQRDNRFVATDVAFIAFSDDPTYRPGKGRRPNVDTVLFSGVGAWNGQRGYRFEVFASDRGEPGRHRESVRITIWDPAGAVVAHVEGDLDGGNVRSTRVRH